MEPDAGSDPSADGPTSRRTAARPTRGARRAPAARPRRSSPRRPRRDSLSGRSRRRATRPRTRAGSPDAPPDRESRADPRADRRPARPSIAARSARLDAAHELAVQEQPAAVLRRRATPRRHASHPTKFASPSSAMPARWLHSCADDERPLERQQIARHEDLEKERIGHPVDAARRKYQSKIVCLGGPEPRSADGRCRSSARSSAAASG